MSKKEIFEKSAALLFLAIIVGMVAFLTFVPMPTTSEKVILMIIGGLMTVAAGALPKLFGSDNSEEKALKEKISSMEKQLAILQSKYDVVSNSHDALMKMLVERHVIEGKGILEYHQHD